MSKRKASTLTLVPASDHPGYEGQFVEIIEQLAREWAALPDSHPMFDGGRRLLQRAQALAGSRRVPDLALVPKA